MAVWHVCPPQRSEPRPEGDRGDCPLPSHSPYSSPEGKCAEQVDSEMLDCDGGTGSSVVLQNLFYY